MWVRTSTLVALTIVCVGVPVVEGQGPGEWLCNIFGGGFGWYDCSYDSYNWWSSSSWYSGGWDGSDHGGGRHEPEDHDKGVNTTSHEAVYLGCFVDASDRALPDARYQMYYYMDIDVCFQYCWELGMRYAGVVFGDECYCGKEDIDYAKHGKAAQKEDCYQTCGEGPGAPGPPSGYATGDWKISVYDLRNASTALEYDVRLINWEKSPYHTSSWYSGIVEIKIDGDWQTICDDDWSMREANVVCRQLGYGRATDFYTEQEDMDSVSPFYDSPNGDIDRAFSNVTCQGREISLTGCKLTKYTTKTMDNKPMCPLTKYVGVECVGPSYLKDDSIELEGNQDQYSGTVLIEYQGVKGYICDDDWDFVDAEVVCHQLGHGAAMEAIRGGGTLDRMQSDIFMLDNMLCSDSDLKYSRTLDECTHGQWNNTDCKSGQKAGVTCHAPGITDIRLADGPNKHEGRLEILHDGRWGTVCDRYWDIEDADVACRMLGYPWAISTTPAGYTFVEVLDIESERDAHWYGPGSGPIHFARLECAGYETTIEDCMDVKDRYFTSTESCKHVNDVGIKCADKSGTRKFPVRLVGGPNKYEGRVEVYWNSHWGTVCGDNWDMNDATVVCRQLGMGNAVRVSHGVAYGENPEWGQLILLDEVNCTGHEYYLSDCGHIGWNNHNCRHFEDAGVECQGTDDDNGIFPWLPPWWSGGQSTTLKPGETRPPGATRPPRPTGPPPRGPMGIRLEGGKSPSEGRVEISHRGAWGTVCNKGWDVNDANVVCNMLGYKGATEDGAYRDFGPGTGHIYLSEVDCSGREKKISDCDLKRGPQVTDCTHDQDAGVVCIDYDPVADHKIAVRLADGTTKSEGHVQVLRNGEWGGVCDIGWDINDANVVCRHIGYSEGAKKQTTGSTFGITDTPIIASSVYCSGKETDLNKCRISWDETLCDSTDQAGVVCLEEGEKEKQEGHGISAPITLIAIGILVIIIAVLITIMLVRLRRKPADDTRPIIPPSNLSDLPVTFSTAMPNHTPIGNAFAIAQAPPVYTPTEEVNKVPLDGGVSADVPAPQGAVGATGGQTGDYETMNGGVVIKPPQASDAPINS